MKYKQKLLIEVVGAIGIVLSLVFVGMQLRIETEVALSEQYANRTESVKSDIRTRLESEDFMAAQEVRWENGFRPPWWKEDYERRAIATDTSPRQVWATIYNLQLGLYQADNLYFQYQQGLLDEEFWSSAKQTVEELLEDDFTRDVYLNSASRLPIHGILIEIDAE